MSDSFSPTVIELIADLMKPLLQRCLNAIPALPKFIVTSLEVQAGCGIKGLVMSKVRFHRLVHLQARCNPY